MSDASLGDESPVKLSDPDPRWRRQFGNLSRRVRLALGAKVLELHHAGSTSVPSLAAKPVIDMVLVVAESADEDAYAPALAAAGFRLMVREPEWYEHRCFRHDRPMANLHVFTRGCPEVRRMLAFRDHLRRDSADRRLYEQVKRELAARDWGNVQEYADAKTGVVAEIMDRALARTRRPPRRARSPAGPRTPSSSERSPAR